MRYILAFILLTSMMFAQSGSGTSEDPYVITTPAEFDNIRIS